jgi:hypothetical protein
MKNYEDMPTDCLELLIDILTESPTEPMLTNEVYKMISELNRRKENESDIH